eukprot:maker-scaffold10_size831480-snap-gene-4.13 protein:Tk01828 transcript:maker-scaffold10_size831480-snap-gene-4.13-mRNA-1 annotation:"15-hydroxyprostaglandin dehydrogenase"
MHLRNLHSKCIEVKYVYELVLKDTGQRQTHSPNSRRMVCSQKVFIVTGSARGVGHGIVERILKEGGRVAISDVLEDEGQKAAKALGKQYGKDMVTFIKCNVTDQQSFENLWDSTEGFFKAPVDVLVNNAGVTHMAGFEGCIDINLKGVMRGTYLALDRMGKTKGSGRGGQVVNVASFAGFNPGTDVETSSYFASKAGVVSLIKTIGNPDVLRAEGVRINGITMTYTDTEMLRKSKELFDSIVKSLGGEENLIPVSRIADAFHALVSKETNNGQVICIVPHTPLWYFRFHDKGTIAFWVMGAKILKRLCPGTTIMEPWQQGIYLFSVFVFVMFALKLLVWILL